MKKQLFIIDKEKNTETLTCITQVAEQSGISENQFQEKYNGSPLEINDDLLGFEYIWKDI